MVRTRTIYVHPADSSLASSIFSRQLFIAAAVTTGSGTVFAWTALRYINGALAIRTEKLAGPIKSISLDYSRNEYWTKVYEEKMTTQQLVSKWKNYNLFRSIVLIAGTIVGAAALFVEAQ